ncbi:MAG: glycine betaine/L-proline ABC transporter ATP-binding protein [Chloroflexi bacterium]|nr:glycine betaine/L-proline ABC transporter ATP-binding protein [Chloroflexota bacterium]
MSAGNGAEVESSRDTGETRIAVRSLWKVFGDNAGLVREPEYANKSKAEIQEELGSVVALRDVSFEVSRGETFVVMGLSGSGKSTLVRCLIRLIEPTSGEVAIDGEDVLKYSGKQLTQLRRRKTAMVFQHFGLLPNRKIIDNVAWGLEVQGVDRGRRHARAREVLELVGLKGWEEAIPEELSGGMQQRVGLARALAVDPEILLMDEPFSALDPLIRSEMQDELLVLQKHLQKTIVFITHDLDEALRLGERIAIMKDGDIIQIGNPVDIVDNPADSYVQDFTRAISRTRVMGASSIMLEPKAVAFESQSAQDALQAMADNNEGHAFVLDSSRNLLGVVTKEQAARSGSWSLREMCVSDPPLCCKVAQDTPIDDLVPLAAETECPIAVVDTDGQLIGVVPRATLLSSLAESQRAQIKEGTPSRT